MNQAILWGVCIVAVVGSSVWNFRHFARHSPSGGTLFQVHDRWDTLLFVGFVAVSVGLCTGWVGLDTWLLFACCSTSLRNVLAIIYRGTPAQAVR